jgi:hypothetical protein
MSLLGKDRRVGLGWLGCWKQEGKGIEIIAWRDGVFLSPLGK